MEIRVPDVGEAKDVEVIEILVAPGDSIQLEDSLVVLESDKASMEIPSPASGIVSIIKVRIGDQVDEGDVLLEMEPAALEADQELNTSAESPDAVDRVTTDLEPEVVEKEQETTALGRQARDENITVPAKDVSVIETASIHAGPAVRKQARQYGVDLNLVRGSARRGRILKEDVQLYVKERLQGAPGPDSVMGIPQIPDKDFSSEGEIEIVKRSRIRRTASRNLHRSWLNIPHVTHFDEADITELEEFRKRQNEIQSVKLTPLAFLIASVVHALKAFPQFNASLTSNGEDMIVKKYYNIGIAVETDDGLLVPVLKRADTKGLLALAEESAALAAAARAKRLPMDAMQAATFTISSLGGIGGTGFTPIINAPQVAILGVSRASVKPVLDGNDFVPRTVLPLALSYDHRAIDGAEAARFLKLLASILTDVRQMLM